MASKLIQLPSPQEMSWRLRLVSSNGHLNKQLHSEITSRCARQTLSPNGLVQRLMEAVDSYGDKADSWVARAWLVERLPQYIAAILDDPRNRVEALEALRRYQPPSPVPPNPQREERQRKRREQAARRKPRGKGKHRGSTSLEDSSRSKRLDERNDEGNDP